jgi:hypothetical protein
VQVVESNKGIHLGGAEMAPKVGESTTFAGARLVVVILGLG